MRCPACLDTGLVLSDAAERYIADPSGAVPVGPTHKPCGLCAKGGGDDIMGALPADVRQVLRELARCGGESPAVFGARALCRQLQPANGNPYQLPGRAS